MEKISNYNHSFLERALIHTVLKIDGIKEFLFDAENFFFNQNKLTLNDENNFFITGLARSGTTEALNIFYDTGDFASLTYDDFPFILSPNIYLKFKKFYKKYNSKLFKRAHNDGILISNKSPEAFDEIFWKKELKDNYIDKKYLFKNSLNEKNINKYRIFISLIKKKENKSKFISKNNNLILRIDSIIKYFKKSSILVFFRDPFFQSNSLLNQHKNFLKLQNKNKFIISYMNYLGHYEFGKNLKTFRIGKHDENDPLKINFWIQQWINYYKYLLTFKSNKNIKFICYEELCKKKNDYIKLKIEDKNLDNLDFNKYLNMNSSIIKPNKNYKLDEAYSIYNDLVNL